MKEILTAKDLKRAIRQLRIRKFLKNTPFLPVYKIFSFIWNSFWWNLGVKGYSRIGWKLRFEAMALDKTATVGIIADGE